MHSEINNSFDLSCFYNINNTILEPLKQVNYDNPIIFKNINIFKTFISCLKTKLEMSDYLDIKQLKINC